MGGFTYVNYQCGNGQNARLKISTDMAPLVGQNQGAVGEVANATASKKSRQNGVRPRYALYFRTITVGTDTFTKYLRVWRTTPAHLQNSPATVQWKGQQYQLGKLVEEDAN